MIAWYAGLLALAIADEPTNEEVPEDSTENSDEADSPLGPSEFAQTTVLFPDFPDKSECTFSDTLRA